MQALGKLGITSYNYWSLAFSAAQSIYVLTQPFADQVKSFTFLGTFYFHPEPSSIKVNKPARLAKTDIMGAMGDRIQAIGMKSPIVVVRGRFFRDYKDGVFGTAQQHIWYLAKLQETFMRSLPFIATSTGDYRFIYIQNLEYETISGTPGDLNYTLTLVQDFNKGAP